MSIFVTLVLEAVERMDAELMRIHHSLRGVAAWPLESSAEMASIRASIRRACQVTREIREQVLDHRGTHASLAHRASALRARGVLVAIEMSELHRAARAAGAPIPHGRLHCVDALREFVLGEVGRINASWLAEAKQGAVDEETILDRAEAAYAALGHDPDVSQFLTWGMAHDSMAFRLACRVLAALFEYHTAHSQAAAIDVPSLPALARRASNANRAEEK